MKILEAERIDKTFPGTTAPIEVLSGVDFAVSEGEVVAILGASGAGKSTLLHILGTLDRPDAGRVLIRGVDTSGCGDRELDRLRNRDLGFVFQFHYLLPEFSALENVMMPAVLGGRPREDASKRARELLSRVDLSDRVEHRPAELSGGEQQRVAVARALMNDPEIVLADEPSGNLDDASSDSLHDLLIELSRSTGQSFVVVTHKHEFVERADRGFLLENAGLSLIGGRS